MFFVGEEIHQKKQKIIYHQKETRKPDDRWDRRGASMRSFPVAADPAGEDDAPLPQ